MQLLEPTSIGRMGPRQTAWLANSYPRRCCSCKDSSIQFSFLHMVDTGSTGCSRYACATTGTGMNDSAACTCHVCLVTDGPALLPAGLPSACQTLTNGAQLPAQGAVQQQLWPCMFRAGPFKGWTAATDTQPAPCTVRPAAHVCHEGFI